MLLNGRTSHGAIEHCVVSVETRPRIWTARRPTIRACASVTHRRLSRAHICYHIFVFFHTHWQRSHRHVMVASLRVVGLLENGSPPLCPASAAISEWDACSTATHAASIWTSYRGCQCAHGDASSINMHQSWGVVWSHHTGRPRHLQHGRVASPKLLSPLPSPLLSRLLRAQR